MSKSILIIGGNGLVGSSLIENLSKSDYKITATYNNNKDKLTKNKNINYVKCNIVNKNSVKKLFSKEKYNIIINAASDFDSSLHTQNSISALVEVNILGHLNLISESVSNNVTLFIYFSSIAVYEGVKNTKKGYKEEIVCHPQKLYAASKIYAENLLQTSCENSSLKGITLRIAGVHGIGRKNGVVYNMFKKSKENNNVFVSEPNSLFRLTFTDDLVLAIKKILKKNIQEKYSLYNLAGDDIFNLRSLAKKITKITGIGKVKEIKNSNSRNQIMNIDKFKNKYNFQTVSLDKKLNKFYKYYKEKL